VPILHGFPLRAAFPALPGYTWVKWLVEIEVK
jgi:DMSO/TMAO reductase YedYZ molybdopterin-dependent catalytic subunit